MKAIQLLLPAVILLLPLQVFAGEFQIAPVKIDLENREAQGNLLAARFSKNEEERIGCAVGHREKTHYAYCEASLGNDTDAYCITFDPAMIDTIASINTMSFVNFRWNKDEVCTDVTVATRSVHISEKLKP